MEDVSTSVLPVVRDRSAHCPAFLHSRWGVREEDRR
jgi:hypothetical protein